MKRNGIGILAIGIFLATLIALGAWDYYMRSTWDDHITTSVPQYFFIKQDDDKKPRTMNKEEIQELPNRYKESLEIVQKTERNYIWASNDNQALTKTVEYPHAKNGNKNIKWIVLHGNDEKSKITIRGSDYLGYSESGKYTCLPNNWMGNITIEYQLDDGRFLSTIVSGFYYENLLQYFVCKL